MTAQSNNTAVLRLDPVFLREKLFHGAQATIIDARFNAAGVIELTIAGPDVPACEEACMVYVQTVDPLGGIKTTAKFEPRK